MRQPERSGTRQKAGWRWVAEIALRTGMSLDDIECIEEGGTEPTVALLRRLAEAMDADVRLMPDHDIGSVRFESHAA